MRPPKDFEPRQAIFFDEPNAGTLAIFTNLPVQHGCFECYSEKREKSQDYYLPCWYALELERASKEDAEKLYCILVTQKSFIMMDFEEIWNAKSRQYFETKE